jgi:hypothetical protein
VPARFGRDLAEARPASNHVKVVRAQRRPLPAAAVQDHAEAIVADAEADAAPNRPRNEVRVFRKRDNDDGRLAARAERLAERKNLKRARPEQARKKARPSGNPV